MAEDEGLRGILVEQVDRLLAASGGPGVLRAAERGEWPEALWSEAEALGLPLALAPEAMGGAGLGWETRSAVWHALGRHGAALPSRRAWRRPRCWRWPASSRPPPATSRWPVGRAGRLGPPRGHVAAVDDEGRLSLRTAPDRVEPRRGPALARARRPRLASGRRSASASLPAARSPRATPAPCSTPR
jgi:acyl-CoA dehydrogenase